MLLLCSGAVQAEKRVALVIGNANYEQSPLANPVNDARAIADRLRGLNFVVQSGINLNRVQMLDAVREFRGRLSAEAIAMVFYAGHAVEYEGRNYLIGVDNGKLRTREDVHADGYELDNLLRQLQASGTQLNVVVLDACRDAPLPSAHRGGSRGLVSVDTSAGATLVAFATSPGRTAADGDGQHSPYTSALLQHLDRPGLRLLDLFNDVAQTVTMATNRQQVPWNSSSSVPNVVLNTKGGETNQLPIVTTPPARPVKLDNWAPANQRSINMTAGQEIVIRYGPSSVETVDRLAARLGRLQMRVRLELDTNLAYSRSTFYFDPSQPAAMEVVRSAFVTLLNPQLSPSNSGMQIVIR